MQNTRCYRTVRWTNTLSRRKCRCTTSPINKRPRHPHGLISEASCVRSGKTRKQSGRRQKRIRPATRSRNTCDSPRGCCYFIPSGFLAARARADLQLNPDANRLKNSGGTGSGSRNCTTRSRIILRICESAESENNENFAYESHGLNLI